MEFDDIRRSVLVLDDDGSFRSLVGDILKARGINVLGARSVREANAIISEGDPLVAIVDYRLGESDGMTWIGQIREYGRNFPVVFLSGTWCDEKTFSWLRNILKVSLILRKPIEPSLFLQQIESLLPTLESLPYESYEDNYPDGGLGQEEETPLSEAADISSDPALLAELKQMRAGQKIKSRLAEAKAKYANELAESWVTLQKELNGAESDPTNRVLLNEALLLAHKIYGTSGSLGFSKVSQAAGKIEELLHRLDPDDTMAGIIWSEIRNCIQMGASEIEHSVDSATAPLTSGINTTNILLVGNDEDFSHNLRNLQTIALVEFEQVDSIAAGVQAAKRLNFEAAVIDFSLSSLPAVLGLTELLRSKHGSTLPIAAIAPSAEVLSDVDALFAGCSIEMREAPDKAGMEQLVNQLICLRDHRKPRILSVNDDELLTDFLSQILSAHNMNIRALNKPIAILQAMEEFQPELVLLDVNMPGLSGYDVCRMLRATDKWSTTPIIFLTSQTDADGRNAAFQAGGTDFLCKPVIAEELIARVRGQLDHASLSQGYMQKDQLTGLMTGDELISELRTLLEQSQNTGLPVSLCFLSIDSYIRLGSEHGWQGAEQILKSMAQLLSYRFRADDYRARLGQDGFALAFPHASKELVERAMKMLRDEFKDMRFPSNIGKSFKATFSHGIADSPSDGRDMQSLMLAANTRLMASRREHEIASQGKG